MKRRNFLAGVGAAAVSLPFIAKADFGQSGFVSEYGFGVGDALIPKRIPGLVAWFRADKLITRNGANVSGWGDLSGNGVSCVQTTEANQPLFLASAVNGRPAIRFEPGDSEELDLTLQLTHAGGATLVAAARPKDINNAFEGVIGCNGNTAGQVATLVKSNTGFSHHWWATGASGGTDGDTTTAAATAGQVDTLIARFFDTPTSQMTINGTDYDNSANAPAAFAASSVSRIGNGRFSAGNFFDGDIFEVAIYDASISDADVVRLHNYLSGRYQ